MACANENFFIVTPLTYERSKLLRAPIVRDKTGLNISKLGSVYYFHLWTATNVYELEHRLIERCDYRNNRQENKRRQETQT